MGAGKHLGRNMGLLAGIAFSAALYGCGAKDSGGGGTESGIGNASPPADATFDANEGKEVAAALQRYLDVATVPSTEPADTERSRGKLDGLAFPTWPVGETRKAGLRTYRIDVSPAFDAKATLRFLDGAKVLFEAPFDPANVRTVASIPAAVYEGLKVGDTVKWGLFFEDKKKTPITAEFKIVEKAAATKKLAKLSADRSVAPLLRDLGIAQVMVDQSLLTEAVALYATLVDQDKTLVFPYRPMADCLQRLHLKNTPLYQDALLRAGGNPSPHRSKVAAGPGDGDTAKPTPGRATDRPAPTPPGDVAKKPAGPNVPPGTPAAPVSADAVAALLAAQQAIEGQAHAAAEHAMRLATSAKEAAASARAAGDKSKDARGAADAAAAAAKALRDKLTGPDSAKLTPAERAALVQEAEAADAAAKAGDDLAKQAKEEADRLARLAEQVAGEAGSAGQGAKELGAQVDGAKELGTVVADASHPNPVTIPQRIALAEKLIRDSAGTRDTAQKALEAATGALDAAKKAAEGQPGADADASVAQAQQARDDAQAALEAANAARDALKKALDALKNP